MVSLQAGVGRVACQFIMKRMRLANKHVSDGVLDQHRGWAAIAPIKCMRPDCAVPHSLTVQHRGRDAATHHLTAKADLQHLTT